MEIKEQIKQEKSELKAKIQEARSAIADGKENADELEKDVEARQKKIQGLEKLASAEADAEIREEPKDSDKEMRALKNKQEEEQRKINGAQGHKIGAVETNDAQKEKEQRDAINMYAHSYGKQFRAVDGVVSTDVGVTIPQQIIYNPAQQLITAFDLSTLVNQVVVSAAAGKLPILARPTDAFPSVAELEANPALAKPSFTTVTWDIQTYRGALAISKESIDDSSVDLTGLIGASLQQRAVNTKNAAIAALIKAFTAAPVASVDDIKKIINVSLDPAYNKVLVVSQSFYQYLDTLKDTTGKYLLQESITSATGKTVLGLPVYPVSDSLLGADGEEHAFIGDLRRAITLFDRAQATVQWANNDVYGQILQGVLRFDTKSADAKAGYFLTHSEA